jgi:hypothetical protein
LTAALAESVNSRQLEQKCYAMKTRLIVIAIVAGCSLLKLQAQPQGLLQQLPEEEQSAIEAIALYPQEERAAVLQAAMHPEILVRMENIRRSTEVAFQERIAELTEEGQEKVYSLIRYPDLLDSICVREERWPSRELSALLASYPEAIQKDAEYTNRKHFELLKEVHFLYGEAEQAFEDVLWNYPEHVRATYQGLAKLPEVVTTLAEHMNMTVLLGDIYRRHPAQLEHELDSLNVVVAEQQAQEVNEWKQQLEENPEVMYEYEQAAQEFAEAQGYEEEVYTEPLEERYTQDIYVHHTWQPYPYWFGWPRWYTYECWYPYPWWYHWGFYYGPRRVIVIVGMPSHSFVHWHFGHYRHFYYYPHFTNHIISHYDNGPRYDTNIRTVVRSWEQQHRRELPQGWFEEDGNRVNRIREFGQFKMDYEESVRTAGRQAPTQQTFLRENARKYPTLEPVLKEQPEAARAQKQARRDYEPYWPRKQYAPEKQEPRRYEPRDRVIERRPQPPKRMEIDRAKERHENTWERIKREPRRETPPQRITPQRQPPKAPQQRTLPSQKQRKQLPQKGNAPAKKQQSVPKRSGNG